MEYLQMVNIELGDKCNLTHHHPECPSNAIRSGKELTDELILGFVDKIYEKGFRGYIAWHFYNEPLLQEKRMFKLMEIIRSNFPKSRFLLWTNCTIVPEDDRVKMFEQVYCTDYLNVGMDRLYSCYKLAKNFWYKGKNIILDDRYQTLFLMKHYDRCLRPLVEFIVDNYGEVHFCCYDWNNKIKIGNIWVDSLDSILEERGRRLKQVCGKRMTEDAPERCLRCHHRESLPETSDFDRQIANEASKVYFELESGSAGQPCHNEGIE